MSNSVRTAGDWMTLFTGSRGERGGTGGPPGSGGSSTLSLTSRYSPPTDYSRYTSRDTRYEEYTSPSYSSRYSSSGLSSRSGMTSPTTSARVSSPPSSRRIYPSRSLASYRYLSEDTERKISRHRDQISPQTSSSGNANDQNSETEADRQSHGNKHGMVLLNQGAVMIRRRGGRPANTSDEESGDENDNHEDNKNYSTDPATQSSQPPRDPLEVEEEELTQKLQTAAFLMSLPEEESIRKRLLEVRQMRENPEFFKLENTRGFKFNNVSSQVAKPNTARIEEEKILLLRLNSRGITEVEQTDVLVRLQGIWRDRMEELEKGVNKLEQEYEHHLTETSTETSELDGSIRGKQAQVAKLQEEILVLSIKKDKVSEDMEKVTSVHQMKLDELKEELHAIQNKSSEYSVLCVASKKESCLPEDERSEIESELECPVCLEISRPPIYQCEEGHIICSSCKPLLKACSLCEIKYSDPPIRCRFAEKLADKYFRHEDD